MQTEINTKEIIKKHIFINLALSTRMKEKSVDNIQKKLPEKFGQLRIRGENFTSWKKI